VAKPDEANACAMPVPIRPAPAMTIVSLIPSPSFARERLRVVR
jgi:hypothetical protein